MYLLQDLRRRLGLSESQLLQYTAVRCRAAFNLLANPPTPELADLRRTCRPVRAGLRP